MGDIKENRMPEIKTVNPATEEVLNTYTVMSEAEAIRAVEATHEAFKDWRKLSHDERAPYLKKIAGKLRDNKEELAELMTREVGKLYQDSLDEVDLCAAIFDWTADAG